MSSLNARAAHTANSQLTLLQDENKRMVAERTVLQTQVCATIRIFNKLTKLGRCDRYTIDRLIIGLNGLLGLLGVQDC